jgi:ELWxxDGT repeat protein
VAFGGALYFLSCEAAYGCEPWTSDGTAAGTRRFADLEPGPGSSLPMELAPIRDRLYFSACRAATGCEPWLTDGTPAGTHRVGDVAPGLAASWSHRFARSGDLVYFAADDTTGEELWAMPIEVFYDGFETGDLSRWSGVGEP